MEDLSAALLTFLAGDAERFDRFLATTGLTVQSLRRAAGSAGFTESLLDYVSSDEPLLLAFAQESGYDAAMVEATRLSLHPPPFDA